MISLYRLYELRGPNSYQHFLKVMRNRDSGVLTSSNSCNGFGNGVLMISSGIAHGH